MQRLRELPPLVLLMALTGAAMLLPAAHAEMLRDHRVARAFVYAAVMVWVLAAMLAFVLAGQRPGLRARGQILSVALPYLVLPPLMALPLLPGEGGGLPFRDAWFEMLSAFTTTGATLYGPPDLPKSVHLWRALVGWLGGYYILVVALAVLAPLNLGGMEVVSGRTPGRSARGVGQITEIAGMGARMARFATGIFPIYGGLTLALWVLLLLAGEQNLVALCHAMSTLSTSGISPVAGLKAGTAGLMGEGLVALFLLLALSRWPLVWALGLGRSRGLMQDAEVRTAGVILLVVPVLLLARLWWGAAAAGEGGNLAAALDAWWGRLFMTLSFLTTTGFESASWASGSAWAHQAPAGTAFWGLAILGGGIATTAGGVKLLRVAALFRHSTDELTLLIHPNAVAGAFGGSRQIAREGIFLAWVFFMLFAMLIAFFVALLTLLGLGFEGALVLSLSALTNTGPLVSTMPDLVQPWASLGTPERVVLGAAMVVGRLDTLAVVVLLLPETWRG